MLEYLDEKEGILTFLSGVAALACAGWFASDYVRREAGPEVEFLRAASAYLQEYQGETPKEAIDFTLRTLQLVEQNDAFKKDVSALEKELLEIRDQIGESRRPYIFRPVLDNVEEQIERMLKDKARPEEPLYPVCLGLLGAIGLGQMGFGSYVLRSEARQKKKFYENLRSLVQDAQAEGAGSPYTSQTLRQESET
ncbi:hypothetical protein D6783_02155 [Candidatus Woesearchaeota archaeon]|nr:MAG: hypothetical protein D6783_02155 [Candidatus Woesearchaeota archaeon]